LATLSVRPLQRFIGMVRSPRATLAGAIRNPRSLDLALLILTLSIPCSAGFLMTNMGRLAALDQQVRQLESFGVEVTDPMYEQLRAIAPYRAVMSAAVIAMGWPLVWLLTAGIVHWFGRRAGRFQVTFAQVLTVIVHASAILAVREIVAAPINYAREAVGGATSLAGVMPAFGESTFPARLLGTMDIFIIWWVVLIAIGLSILYQVRTLPIVRWFFGAYAGAAAVLALTQALRGGV
jgi:hypothetical protein